MTIIERYNLQKGHKQKYYDTPIDNLIASHLKMREKVIEQEEQKKLNEAIEKEITEKINKAFKDILK